MTYEPKITILKDLTEEQAALWGAFLYDAVQQMGQYSNNITRRCYNYVKKINAKKTPVDDEDARELVIILADGIEKGLEVDRQIVDCIRLNQLPIKYESHLFGLKPVVLNQDHTPLVNLDGPPAQDDSQNDGDNASVVRKSNIKGKLSLGLRKNEFASPQTSDSVDTVGYDPANEIWEESEDDCDRLLKCIMKGEISCQLELNETKPEQDEEIKIEPSSQRSISSEVPTEILSHARVFREEQGLISEDETDSIKSASQESYVFDIHDYYMNVGETEKSIGDTANESQTKIQNDAFDDEIATVVKDEIKMMDEDSLSDTISILSQIEKQQDLLEEEITDNLNEDIILLDDEGKLIADTANESQTLEKDDVFKEVTDNLDEDKSIDENCTIPKEDTSIDSQTTDIVEQCYEIDEEKLISNAANETDTILKQDLSLNSQNTDIGDKEYEINEEKLLEDVATDSSGTQDLNDICSDHIGEIAKEELENDEETKLLDDTLEETQLLDKTIEETDAPHNLSIPLDDGVGEILKEEFSQDEEEKLLDDTVEETTATPNANEHSEDEQNEIVENKNDDSDKECTDLDKDDTTIDNSKSEEFVRLADINADGEYKIDDIEDAVSISSDVSRCNPEIVSILSDDNEADDEIENCDSDSADSYIGLDQLRENDEASKEQEISVKEKELDKEEQLDKEEGSSEETEDTDVDEDKNQFMRSLNLLGKDDYDDVLKVSRVEYCKDTRGSRKKALEADLIMKRLMDVNASTIDALAQSDSNSTDGISDSVEQDLLNISDSEVDEKSDISSVSVSDSDDKSNDYIALEELCHIVDRDYHEERDAQMKNHSLKDCTVVLSRLPDSFVYSKLNRLSDSEDSSSDSSGNSKEVDLDRSTSSESEFELQSDDSGSSDSDINDDSKNNGEAKLESESSLDSSYDGDESDNDSTTEIEILCSVHDRDFHNPYEEEVFSHQLREFSVMLSRLQDSLVLEKLMSNRRKKESDIDRSTSSESELELQSDDSGSSDSDIDDNSKNNGEAELESESSLDSSYDGDESDNDSTTEIEMLCSVHDRDFHNPYEEEVLSHQLRECSVMLTRLQDSLVFEKLMSNRRKKESDIDRLCDLNNLDKKRRHSNSSNERSKRRKKLRLKKTSDEESSNTDRDMFELSDENIPSERDSPLPDGRDVLAEIICNDMDAMDKDKYMSASEDDDPNDKKKKGKEKKADAKEKVVLTAEEKAKQKWKSDPLLRGRILSDSDSENEPKIKKKKKTRALLSDSDVEEITSGSYESDSSADVVVNIPKEKLTQKDSDDSSSPFSSSSSAGSSSSASSADESADSDVEFLSSSSGPSSDFENVSKYERTPTKKDGDSISEPGSGKKGRKNIRKVIADTDLAEATQIARHEEEERINRLEAKTKVLSQISSSQSQEEDRNKIILDFDHKTTDPIVTVDSGLCKDLKNHQVAGVKFLWDACFESVEKYKTSKGTGCILAHCMGLGKTLQIIVLIHTLFSHEALGIKHILIVCPLSTVRNWEREFNFWLKKAKNRCKFAVLTLVDKKFDKIDIVRRWRHQRGVLIMGYEAYEILTNESKTLKKIPGQRDKLEAALIDPGPELIVCDEGHLLKNGKTLRTQALMNISTLRRIVLTGTPLQNNLKEYYYMVQFVKPNLLGTYKEYQNAFVNPIENGQYDDSSVQDIKMMKKRIHVLQKLLKKTIHRFEVSELKIHLDTIVDYALFIQLHPVQIELYKKYLEIVTSIMNSTDRREKSFLRDYQMIGIICSHPYLLYLRETQTKKKKKEYDTIINPDEPEEVNSKALPAKWYCSLCPEDVKDKMEYGPKYLVVQAIIEEAENIGDKVLIFSKSIIELNALEHFLTSIGTAKCKRWRKNVDFFRMDGTVLPSERTGLCDKFNDRNNQKARVFIMSHRVGGLGLNLTAANRVILMGVNFNPSYDTQSIYRAYRFGQEKPCYVYRLIAMGTMEEKLYQRCITKLAQFGRVVDKHQIDRHYSRNEVSEFYEMMPRTCEERPTPHVPSDGLLADILQKNKLIFKFHEHEALLENKPDEALSESEKNSAWEEYNTVRKMEIETAKRIAAGLPPNIPQVYPNMPGSSGINQMAPMGMLNPETSVTLAPHLQRPIYYNIHTMQAAHSAQKPIPSTLQQMLTNTTTVQMQIPRQMPVATYTNPKNLSAYLIDWSNRTNPSAVGPQMNPSAASRSKAISTSVSSPTNTSSTRTVLAVPPPQQFKPQNPSTSSTNTISNLPTATTHPLSLPRLLDVTATDHSYPSRQPANKNTLPVQNIPTQSAKTFDRNNEEQNSLNLVSAHQQKIGSLNTSNKSNQQNQPNALDLSSKQQQNAVPSNNNIQAGKDTNLNQNVPNVSQSSALNSKQQTETAPSKPGNKTAQGLSMNSLSRLQNAPDGIQQKAGPSNLKIQDRENITMKPAHPPITIEDLKKAMPRQNASIPSATSTITSGSMAKRTGLQTARNLFPQQPRMDPVRLNSPNLNSGTVSADQQKLLKTHRMLIPLNSKPGEKLKPVPSKQSRASDKSRETDSSQSKSSNAIPTGIQNVSSFAMRSKNPGQSGKNATPAASSNNSPNNRITSSTNKTTSVPTISKANYNVSTSAVGNNKSSTSFKEKLGVHVLAKPNNSGPGATSSKNNTQNHTETVSASTHNKNSSKTAPQMNVDNKKNKSSNQVRNFLSTISQKSSTSNTASSALLNSKKDWFIGNARISPITVQETTSRKTDSKQNKSSKTKTNATSSSQASSSHSKTPKDATQQNDMPKINTPPQVLEKQKSRTHTLKNVNPKMPSTSTKDLATSPRLPPHITVLKQTSRNTKPVNEKDVVTIQPTDEHFPPTFVYDFAKLVSPLGRDVSLSSILAPTSGTNRNTAGNSGTVTGVTPIIPSSSLSTTDSMNTSLLPKSTISNRGRKRQRGQDNDNSPNMIIIDEDNENEEIPVAGGKKDAKASGSNERSNQAKKAKSNDDDVCFVQQTLLSSSDQLTHRLKQNGITLSQRKGKSDVINLD